jgi:transmembrane sensor
MSGAHADSKIFDGAQSVDALAAQFLIRRRNHADWTADDESQFSAWLSQSLAHKAAYWRLEAIWERADRLSALRVAKTEDAAESSLQSRITRWRAVLATIAVSACVVASGFLLHAPHTIAYSTPIGGHLDIRLTDGSRVELNTDTVLRASLSDHERIVTLDKGEAYFQISHDRSTPFFVMAAGHRVVDLGTKFLVRRNADRVEVALIEGRARIETAASSHPPVTAVLKPGDFAVIARDTVSVSKKNTDALADQLGWRRGVLVFDHMALADAAAEFNRYNNRKIVVVGPSIAGLEIVGTFPVNDIDLFGRAVKTVLGLNVERHGEEILISR